MLPFCPKQHINTTAFSRDNCEGCSFLFFSLFPFLLSTPSLISQADLLPLSPSCNWWIWCNQVFLESSFYCLSLWLSSLSIKERWPVVCSFVLKILRCPHRSTNRWNICYPSSCWRVSVEQYRGNTLSEKLSVFLLFLAQVCILFGVTMTRDYIFWCFHHAFYVGHYSSVVICRRGAEGERRREGKHAAKSSYVASFFLFFSLQFHIGDTFICYQACYWYLLIHIDTYFLLHVSSTYWCWCIFFLKNSSLSDIFQIMIFT